MKFQLHPSKSTKNGFLGGINIFMDNLVRNPEENKTLVYPNLCIESNSNVTNEEMLQE